MEKLRATGLLGLAAVILGLTYLSHSGGAGWLGYVRAGAEAAMVGGLADWFAVTALFRHPLGLPIPHTALIPRRKDDLGRTLGAFMQENFLSGDVVVARLRSMQVVDRIGSWLAQPDHALAVTNEIAELARGALDELRKDDVTDVMVAGSIKRFAGMSYAPMTGRFVNALLEADTQRRLVDIGVPEIRRWFVDHPDLVMRTLAELGPAFVPRFLKNLTVERVYDGVLDLLVAVERDPEHELRRSLDEFLRRYAEALVADGPEAAAFDALVQNVLANTGTAALIAEVVDRLYGVLDELASDPVGELRAAIRVRIMELGYRGSHDEAFNHRLEALLERFVVHVTETYADVFIRFITDTVADWDATEATRRIELNVGRDLQFIRINGTVVGAVAGLAIHTVTSFF